MAKLLLNNGGGPAQEFQLPSGLSRVGRNSANEIPIEHPSVSSFHCEINAGGDCVTIKDLGSTNGTFLDGQPIQESTLAHGQSLRLGAVQLTLDAPETIKAPLLVDGAPSLVPTMSKPRLSVRTDQTHAPVIEVNPVIVTPTTQPTSRPMPQVNRDKAEQEARSKMLWGDPVEEVVKFLRMQGLSIEEASTMGNSLLLERVKMLRGIGVQKIFTGIGLMCVPVISFVGFLKMGVFPVKLFAMTVMVGLYGAWRLLKGTFMVFAPKSESGDVADK
ncbi:MAG: domain containing protein [Verrucomicrobiales bacterium]|nr:domain containing protein [Verrucomicrobiales bacterium]